MTLAQIVRKERKSPLVADIESAQSGLFNAENDFTDYLMETYNLSEDDAIEVLLQIKQYLD